MAFSTYTWKTLVTDVGSIYDKCGENAPYTLLNGLTGTGDSRWIHEVDEYHYFIIDLGAEYKIAKVRGLSNTLKDPTDVDIYLAGSGASPPDDAPNKTTGVVPAGWGSALNDTAITEWQDTATYVERVLDSIPHGRWLLVVINDTESVDRYLRWGVTSSEDPIFQIFANAYTGVTKPTRYQANAYGDHPTDADWGIFGTGSGHYDRVAKGTGVEEGVRDYTNGTPEFLMFTIMAQGPILALRIFQKGRSHTTYNTKRNVVFQVQIDATPYSIEGHALSDTNDIYYCEWEKNPSTGNAWTDMDLVDLAAGFKSAGAIIDNGGGEVYECWIEIVVAPNSTDAYLTHSPYFGGVTDGAIKVWGRASAAKTMKIAYATDANLANLKATTDPGNPGSGVTVVTMGTASADHDYCLTKEITGLNANTNYNFNLFVDDNSAYHFEDGDSDSNSFWYVLPTCKTFPTQGTWADFEFIFAGDEHSEVLNYRIWKSMMEVVGVTPRLMVSLGDHHGEDTDALDTGTELWDTSHREAYKWRRGFAVPARHMTHHVSKKLPTARIWSDHDHTGDNSSKDGYRPKNIYDDPVSGSGYDINLNATTSRLSINDQLPTHNSGFTIKLSNCIYPANDGTYRATIYSRTGSQTELTLTPGIATTETPGGGKRLELFFARTYNALDTFKDYSPEYSYSAPNDLEGTATGGDANTLVDTGTTFPTTGVNGIYPGMVVHHFDSGGGSHAFSYVKSVSGNTVELYQDLTAEEAFANGDKYRILRGGLWRSFWYGKAEFFIIDCRYKRDASFVDGHYGSDILDGTRQYVDPKSSGTANTDLLNHLKDTTANFVADGVVGGDLVHNKTADTWAVVAAGGVSTTEIDLVDGYGSETSVDLFPNGTELYEIFECGSSDHGSKTTNENKGHIQREWLIDAINNSTAQWKFLICEFPFQDATVGFRDKWGDTDPLKCQRDYLLKNLNNINVIWFSADRHYAALYDGVNAINPWPNANASPLYCEYQKQPIQGNHLCDTSWVVRESEVDKYAGWGRDDADYCHNFGCFGIAKCEQGQITITLYGPDGNVLSNNVQLETGGTATSNPTEEYFYDNAAGWTTDEHISHTLKIVSGTASGKEYVIDDNESSSLICTGETMYTDGVRSGDSYEIWDKMKMTGDPILKGNLSMLITSESYFIKKWISDNLGMTDASDFFYTFLRKFSDNEGMTDAVTSLIKITKVISDALGITDSHFFIRTLNRLLSNNVGLTDVRATAQDLIRLLSEAEGISDAIVTKADYIRILSEAEGLTDVSLPQVTFDRKFSEAAGISDAFVDTLYILIIKKISESMGITDSRITILSMQRLLSENMGLTDVRKSFVTLVRLLSEISGLTDALTKEQAFEQRVSDDEGITDIALHLLTIIRLFSDNSGITDALVSSLTSEMIIRLLSDDMGLTDDVVDLLFKLFWKLVSDVEGLADDYFITQSLIRNLADLAAVTDPVVKTQSMTRRLSDVEGVEDAIKWVLTVVKRISDNIGLSDQVVSEFLAYVMFKLTLVGSKDYMQITPTAREAIKMTATAKEFIGFTMTTFDSEVVSS